MEMDETETLWCDELALLDWSMVTWMSLYGLDHASFQDNKSIAVFGTEDERC
jgi:hypothetical protein